jgi:hypothetical protein
VIRRLSRYAFRIALGLLTLGIVVVGSFLVLVAVPDLSDGVAVVPSPGRTPAPSATPRSPMGLSPVGIEMPADADCTGCHLTTSGHVGTRPIPVMAHPLAGWRDCTACHAPERLVETAPGHTSLHKDDCLICHQTRLEAGASEVPQLRPEHMGTDRSCSSCHGVDDHAPLPASMAGRGDNCWICHNGPEFTYLFEATPPAAPPSAAPPDASPAPSAETSYRLDPPGT